ncbi:MAG: queuine tRNA-ribosyltransferase, queuine tRNA-ribosyltransferase [Candidatus Parcubacteria bacterium]|jgi:queuine tRNA-ribosyltransferase/7-cyano-7-deazaguanine tRNA-ribosyltransferase
MALSFEITARDSKSRARVGRLAIDDRVAETPAYVAVATNGYIRTVEPEDIPRTKTQIAIANTYHLWRELGDEGLESYPGLHAGMEWNDGIIMTDSGGFQVFSFGASREHAVGKISSETGREFRSGESMVRVTEAGVYFRDPTFAGADEEQYLDAELSMRIQEQLGADIIFAFDEPSSPHHDKAYTRTAMERTHRWAERSLEAKTSEQALYGIVQGGAYEDLRKESARYIGNLPCAGFGIGGAFSNSFGDTHERTADELLWTIPLLPENKPRHLLGIGRVEDIFVGVEAGIDTFDCVIPTREARHGALWTKEGRLDIGGKGKYADDGGPIAEGCECPTCADEQVSRRELHDLFRSKDLRAGRLATIHNLYFFNELMERIREGIREDNLAAVRRAYLERTGR